MRLLAVFVSFLVCIEDTYQNLAFCLFCRLCLQYQLSVCKYRRLEKRCRVRVVLICSVLLCGKDLYVEVCQFCTLCGRNGELHFGIRHHADSIRLFYSLAGIHAGHGYCLGIRSRLQRRYILRLFAGINFDGQRLAVLVLCDRFDGCGLSVCCQLRICGCNVAAILHDDIIETLCVSCSRLY